MSAMAMQLDVEPFGAAASRDEELVRFLGRHGIATVAQVMREFAIGRTAAYRLAAACRERGRACAGPALAIRWRSSPPR